MTIFLNCSSRNCRLLLLIVSILSRIHGMMFVNKSELYIFFRFDLHIVLDRLLRLRTIVTYLNHQNLKRTAQNFIKSFIVSVHTARKPQMIVCSQSCDRRNQKTQPQAIIISSEILSSYEITTQKIII